jgi:hypothetical protein
MFTNASSTAICLLNIPDRYILIFHSLGVKGERKLLLSVRRDKSWICSNTARATLVRDVRLFDWMFSRETLGLCQSMFRGGLLNDIRST